MERLPADIIHRIIGNHLPRTSKSAIQLSRLCKDILSAVQTRPFLVFEWDDDDDKQEEIKHLFSTLTRYVEDNIHLDTFGLTYKALVFDQTMIDQTIIDQLIGCIRLAAAKNLGLENLTIKLLSGLNLPKPVFEAESLVRFNLTFCRLLSAESMITTWPNLKRLRLSQVDIIGEGVFENIIRGCPLIEILEIRCCYNISNLNFKVSNLGHLKKLVIGLNWGLRTLELGAAPNLEFLTCVGSLRFQVDLGVYKYHNLKSITLSSGGPSAFIDIDSFIHLVHEFPLLEKLEIRDTNLEKMNIASSSLRWIGLKNIQGLQEASFDVPNIVRFMFMNIVVVPKLSFAGIIPSYPLFTFNMRDDSSLDTSWFLELKEFLAAMNIVAANRCFSVTFDEEVATMAVASVPGLVPVLLTFACKKPAKPVSLTFARKIMDGILLISRPQRIMIKDWFNCEFPKALYDQLMLNNTNSIDADMVQPHVYDHEKVLELFKVVDDDDADNKLLTISFDLDYY